MASDQDITETGSLYSRTIGTIYVFNLIVGTGALTMPKAFSNTGYLLGSVLVAVLCVMSYITVTFVIESMASANAMLRWKRMQKIKKSGDVTDEDVVKELEIGASSTSERTPLLEKTGECISAAKLPQLDYYEISKRIEMGQMTTLFFNKWGVNFFYVFVAIYLYGDLAIYAAAVPKSLRDVACTAYNDTNSSCSSSSGNESAPCWPGSKFSITRFNAYRLFLAAFALFICPFVFFNVQKTKYLQLFTSCMRWLAFSIMIVIASIRLAQGKGKGNPDTVNIPGLPTLFGVCVYSFMCHHSLPSLVTPIREKSRLYLLFFGNYVMILFFYLLLSITAVFTFSKLEDLYTLNFQPSGSPDAIINIKFIQYFLALFPVFTLSTNFPIIAITLRNNLKTLFYKEGRRYHWCLDRILFPLLTVIPPIGVSFITHNLEFLVSVTGSYAGAVIQYIVPALLVYYARHNVALTIGSGIKNKFTSPFKHSFWVVLVLMWAATSIVFVTVNHIIQKK